MLKTWPALLVVLFLSVTSVRAETGQAVLDSLIQSALKNYPDIVASRHAELTAESVRKSAGGLPDPMLSVGLLNLPVESFSLAETPMSGISVGLTQMIPWPGKRGDRADLAEVALKKTEQSTRQLELGVAREVTVAYLDYSYWTEAIHTISEYLDLLSATGRASEVRYENGQASAQDVVRVSLMQSRADIRLEDARQKQHAALLKLWRATTDSTVMDGLPSYLPVPNDTDLGQLSPESNPMVASAELSITQAEIKTRQARRDYWPDLTLGVDYRFRQDLPGDPVRGEDFISFKLGVNLPLWFGKKKHQVRAARYATQVSQAQERSVRDAIATRMRDVQSRLEFTRTSLTQYDTAILPEAETAVKTAQVAYEVGRIDFNALLLAQSDLLEVKLARLDFIRQYQQSLAGLRELSGVRIER